MKHLYTITLRKPDGGLINYNVLATDALEGSVQDPSALTKALAKMQADLNVQGRFYSANTLAENVVE